MRKKYVPMSKGVLCSPRTDGQTDIHTDTQTDRHECEYRGHPFRVSGIFPSTYHQGSVQYHFSMKPPPHTFSLFVDTPNLPLGVILYLNSPYAIYQYIEKQSPLNPFPSHPFHPCVSPLICILVLQYTGYYNFPVMHTTPQYHSTPGTIMFQKCTPPLGIIVPQVLYVFLKKRHHPPGYYPAYAPYIQYPPPPCIGM